MYIYHKTHSKAVFLKAFHSDFADAVLVVYSVSIDYDVD